MAMPRYDSRNSRIPIANGRASAEPPSAHHSQTATANVKPLIEATEYDTLHKGRDNRAVVERAVPERAAAWILEKELEGDAAKGQSDQHHEDREVDGQDDDGKGQRKGGEQLQAAE